MKPAFSMSDGQMHLASGCGGTAAPVPACRPTHGYEVPLNATFAYDGPANVRTLRLATNLRHSPQISPPNIQGTGLDYFGARYFSGAQGRFTSPDPEIIPENIANPQAWNKYAYTYNNPLRFTDPDGRAPQEGAALRQDAAVRDYVAGRITREQLADRMGVNGPIGLGVAGLGLMTGGAAIEAGSGILALGQAALGWALSNPEKAQQAAVAAVEQISGVPMPNAASTFGFAKVEGTIEGYTYGRLANGAEVAAQFTQSGRNLTASVLGAFNPEGAKAAGTLNAIVSGAQAVAKSQGATSLTLQAVGVINPKLAP